MRHSGAYAAAEETCWAGLYRTAAGAAAVTAVAVVLGVTVFLAWPPATTASVAAWFAHFQANWLRGMLDLDLLMLISNLAAIPIWVAGFIALRRTSPTLATLAAPLGLVGAATYFSSSRLFEMLALSSLYAAATNDAQRAMLEAAGQSMLTTYLGVFAATTGTPPPLWGFQGTAFNVSFALSATAGILLSLAMLRSPAFGKLVGYVGLAGNAVAFGLFVPLAGIWLSVLSLPLLLVWYALLAQRFWRLAHFAVPVRSNGGCESS